MLQITYFYPKPFNNEIVTFIFLLNKEKETERNCVKFFVQLRRHARRYTVAVSYNWNCGLHKIFYKMKATLDTKVFTLNDN